MAETIKRICSAAAFAVVASLGLAAVRPATAADIARGSTFTLARPDEPLTLDPFIPSDNGSIYAIAQICEPLISADDKGTGLVPGLAESWTVSPDKLTYVFKLRDGVKFSDGQPLTADDAVFSLKKVANPAASYGFAFASVKSISKSDNMHVKIVLKKPYAALLSALSLFSSAVVEKAVYEKDPKAFGEKPVCTGPFKVQSYERGSQLVLVRNPYYWQKGKDGKPLPYLDKAVLKYVPESNSRVLGLQNGDFDAVLAVPFNQAATIKTVNGAKLEVAPSYRLDYVYLNHAKKPIDNKLIRLAMNYSANREAILKAVYYGYGSIPNSFMPKVNFWSPDVKKIPFDMAKAKALVKQANYDGTPIHLMVDTGNATSRKIATILQSAWTTIGLKVDIQEYDVGTAFSKTEKGDYQAYVSYITSDINDSDELATLEADYTGATHSFFSWYKNDKVVSLLAQARQTSDKSKRAKLYAQIQDIVYHDGYSVPLNFRPYVNAYRTDVRNWHNLTVGWWWLKDVWIAKK